MESGIGNAWQIKRVCKCVKENCGVWDPEFYEVEH